MITVYPTNTDFLRPNDCIDIYPLHFLLYTGRWIKQSEKLAAEAEQPDLTPKLDLSFKEGQTIHINLGVSMILWDYSRLGNTPSDYILCKSAIST